MSLPHMKIAFVVLAAIGVAVYGVGQLAASPDTDPGTTEATVDSLDAQVTSAGWVDMDHNMSDQPGFQMPSSMMPGMPEGDDQRLGIEVTLVNTSEDTRPLRPAEEFTLHTSKDDKTWEPKVDTFDDLARLAPGNGVNGTVFFDLPPAALADSTTWIEWTRGDTTTRLSLPGEGAGDAPDHSHNH